MAGKIIAHVLTGVLGAGGIGTGIGGIIEAQTARSETNSLEVQNGRRLNQTKNLISELREKDRLISELFKFKGEIIKLLKDTYQNLKTIGEDLTKRTITKRSVKGDDFNRGVLSLLQDIAGQMEKIGQEITEQEKKVNNLYRDISEVREDYSALNNRLNDIDDKNNRLFAVLTELSEKIEKEIKIRRNLAGESDIKKLEGSEGNSAATALGGYTTKLAGSSGSSTDVHYLNPENFE